MRVNRSYNCIFVANADSTSGRETAKAGVGSVAPDVHGAVGGRGGAQASERPKRRRVSARV